MLATQTIGMWGEQPGVGFTYQNPVTGSLRGAYPTELDPLGLNAGLLAQEGGPIGGGDAPDLVFPRFGDILNGETGCTLNGAMVSCDSVMGATERGDAFEVTPATMFATVTGPDGVVESFSYSITWNSSMPTNVAVLFPMMVETWSDGTRISHVGGLGLPFANTGDPNVTVLSSMTRSLGYAQTGETEKELTSDQRKRFEKVKRDALKALRSSVECLNYIKGNSSLNPIDVIENMPTSSYTYFNGIQFAAGESTAAAGIRGGWTRQGNTSTPAHVVLGFTFFDDPDLGGDTIRWSVDTGVARAEILLHEFMHYISQNRDHTGWDANIYEKCFGATQMKFLG